MSDLLKTAIADAKAVRESAYAQAKEVLEESFAPQLQKMIAAKLQEMEVNEEEELEEVENLEENSSELEEEFNLDEILAELNEADELEEGEEEEDELPGPPEEKGMFFEAGKEEEEAPEAEEAPEGAEEEEGAEEGEGAEEENEEIGEMTVQELKDLIQQIVDEEMAGGDESDKDGQGDQAGDSMGDNFGADVNPPADDQAGMMEEDESINLEELLAELAEGEDEGEEELEEGKTWKDKGMKDRGPKPPKSSKKQVSEEIEEAYKVIKHLQSELHEINLLNSRLLYSNKLFMENNSLSESQKIKIIKSFDQVSTPKEAKLVYSTLSEGLATKKSTKKTALKESLSFASKAAGTSTSSNIVELDPVVARFRQLINYNK